jgi:hypothetical protein
MDKDTLVQLEEAITMLVVVELKIVIQDNGKVNPMEDLKEVDQDSGKVNCMVALEGKRSSVINVVKRTFCQQM